MREIRRLGPLEVLVDETTVVVAGSRARSLLAVLALTPGQPVGFDTLVERLWGDDPPVHPRPSLHTAVRRLRQLLGADAIRTTEHGYVLDVEPDRVDAVEFSRLVDVGERHELVAALALWRGEPFDLGFCEWLERYEKPRLTESWLTARERLADLDLPTGQPGMAISDLQDLVRRHPLRESLWVRLLRALHGAGRTAEALEQYGVVRGRIVDELGVEPGAGLRQVFEQLLAGEPVSPAGLVPEQLPSDVRCFIGRSEALAALDKQLASRLAGKGPITAVVVHGQGGSGKTCLAVHWGHLCASEFPDGQLFVDLHGYGPGEPVHPAAALEDLLSGLGVPADRIPVGTEARSALLRSTLSGRRTLVVLDNARSADQVRPLLPGAGAFVIVTSRNRLRGLVARDRAEQIGIDHLPTEEARSLLAGLIGLEDGAADPLLDELATQCGQLPLALAIAAEQVTRRPGGGLADVVGELRVASERLDLLDVGGDPAADLRAVFSWSYRALGPETARFFRLLGLYPAPAFSVAAAAALAGVTVPAATKLLRQLTDLHLVGEMGAKRFQLHDLLRAYAAEQVQATDPAGDRRQAWGRLLDWALHTAAAARTAQDASNRLDYVGSPAAGTVPLGFDGESEAHAWFEAEWRSLLAMVEEGAGHGHHAAVARIALQLWEPLSRRSAFEDSAAVQRVAANSARSAGDRLCEALAMNQLGTSLGALSRLDEARVEFERSLAMLRAIDRQPDVALVHGNLGVLHQLLGDNDESLRHYEAALAIYRLSGDARCIANMLNNSAMTYLRCGRHDEAVRAAAEAVVLQRQGNDRRWLAFTLDTLGQAYAAVGDRVASIKHFEESVEIHLQIGETGSAAEALVELGSVLRVTGEAEAARSAYERAIGLIEEFGLTHLETERARAAEQIAILDS